ncbi:class I SAM-dependent methyltransferase [Oscillatoria sp. FACHB-1407]|nr:class I SAM-dependent methyltransferase [Oscillatoria sp. FACHB-1407]
MTMVLKQVVPFGRSRDEYVKMFNLTEEDCDRRILGVGDGPASFNAEMTQRNKSVISVDPLYQFSGLEILERFNQVLEDIIQQIRNTPDDWVWSYHKSPGDLKWNRVKVIHTFVEDYERGKQTGRYQVGELPKLEFSDQQFDLALCSHFLFLYADHFDELFHRDAITEMLRVSREVRIFPLVTLMLKRPLFLDAIIDSFKAQNYFVDIAPVEYELQKGGNQMLVIRHL